MGVRPEDEFVPDQELRSLLENWNAPEPSRVLDKRILTSFQREFSGADGLSQSVLLPQRREEVVLMKFCTRCDEEFAEKFSFCPVDGTPLTTVDAKAKAEEPSLTVSPRANYEEPSLTVSKDEPAAWVKSEVSNSTPPPVVETPAPAPAAYSSSTAMVLRDEYHLTIMDDAGLVARLAHEVRDTAHEYELTWPEFKRDPFGFTKRTIIGYGQMLRKFLGKPNVMVAMGAAFLAMLSLVGAVVLMDRTQGAKSSRFGLIGFAIVAAALLIGLFSTWLGKERGAAVMGAEASDSRSVVIAMCASFLFLFSILGIVVWADRKHRQQELLAQNEQLQVEQMLDIPNEQPTPDPGTAGLNKGSGGGSKPKPERAQGGGGGGREEQKPASFGKVPQASLDVPQVVAPDPKPVLPKNPALPVAATVVADPMLVPPDARVLPYGDYKSKSTEPS
jgi:hypothetical protein